MKRDMWAQGDVLIVPVDAIPAGAVPVEPEGDRYVLAHGEATGHHHSIRIGPTVAMFRDDGAGSGGASYLRAEAPALLEHQEHATVALPPGSYRVVRQRVARAGMARRVED